MFRKNPENASFKKKHKKKKDKKKQNKTKKKAKKKEENKKEKTRKTKRGQMKIKKKGGIRAANPTTVQNLQGATGKDQF